MKTGSKKRMYKCDRCYNLIADGELPACIEACPENVQTNDPRDEIIQKAQANRLAALMAEHGVGVEKLGLMSRLFAKADLEAMARVREAFNPGERLSPGKLLPSPDGPVIEQTAPGRRALP